MRISTAFTRIGAFFVEFPKIIQRILVCGVKGFATYWCSVQQRDTYENGKKATDRYKCNVPFVKTSDVRYKKKHLFYE